MANSNVHLVIKRIMVIAFSITFAFSMVPLQNVHADDPVIRVAVGGSMDSQCGGGWDINALDASDRPCDMQFALTTRADTTSGLEWSILVKSGTYFPSNDPTNRSATFQLKNGVALYGGYAGTETTGEDRDWKQNPTILNGDIDKDGTLANNSYHVVTGSGTGSSARLDGFTIQGGNAERDLGGGIYNYEGSPRLINLTLQDNAAMMGGGIANWYNSNPDINNLVISHNSGYGMYNYESRPNLEMVTFSYNLGGMVNESNSDSRLFQVTFLGNSDVSNGGGMANYDSAPDLLDVNFIENRSSNFGGGMYNEYSNPVLFSVTFTKNSADCGGGIANFVEANPKLTSVTFDQNSAVRGGALCDQWTRPSGKTTLTNVTIAGNTATENASAIYADYGNVAVSHSTLTNNVTLNENGSVISGIWSSSIRIQNSIIWGNTTDLMKTDSSSMLSVNYSDIKDNALGTSNINLDPKLGVFGDYGGNMLTVPLLPESPAINQLPVAQCVDADNSPVIIDQRGIRRPQGGKCDMGAFEFKFPYPLFLPAAFH